MCPAHQLAKESSVPCLFYSGWIKPVSKGAHSSALQTWWTQLGWSHSAPPHPPKDAAFPEYVCLLFSFFSSLCLLSWFNPVRPSHSVKAPILTLQSNPLLLPLFSASPFQNNRPKPSLCPSVECSKALSFYTVSSILRLYVHIQAY